MVIQPMAIVAAQGTCAQGSRIGVCCEAKTVCTACKSCEVKTEGKLCGCCSDGEDDAGGCCTKKDANPQLDEVFGEISDIVPEPSVAAVAKTFDTSESDETLGEFRYQVSLSSCMCGVHSEPLAPTPHRVPVSEARDLVVIAYLDHVGSDAGLSVRPSRVDSRLPIGRRSPHFSQRFLCIWRI
jgi:hypothetical protein